MKRFYLIVAGLLFAFACQSTPSSISEDASRDAQPHKYAMGGGLQLIVFASSTTWTPPGGVSRVTWYGCGGGGSGGSGGGANAAGNFGEGGGGGGASQWFSVSTLVTPGTLLTIHVGSGGAAVVGVLAAAGNPGNNGEDSYVAINSSNNIVVDFPGASGGDLGQLNSASARGFGGMPYASGLITIGGSVARSTQLLDIGSAIFSGSVQNGIPVLYPGAGGRGSAITSTAGSAGQPSFLSAVTGSTSNWAGGGGGASGTNTGAGGGGGGGSLGAGGAGGAARSVASLAGLPGSAPFSNTCAGGGGGGGGSAGASVAGGAGGAGGSGEIWAVF